MLGVPPRRGQHGHYVLQVCKSVERCCTIRESDARPCLLEFSSIKILHILTQVCVFDALRSPQRTHRDLETSMLDVLDDRRRILAMVLESLQNDVVAVLLFQIPAFHPKLIMRILKVELHESLRVCRFE